MYLIKSTEHKWLVWKTNIPTCMKDSERFRDNKNNHPIAVPQTRGNRKDFIANKHLNP